MIFVIKVRGSSLIFVSEKRDITNAKKRHLLLSPSKILAMGKELLLLSAPSFEGAGMRVYGGGGEGLAIPRP